MAMSILSVQPASTERIIFPRKLTPAPRRAGHEAVLRCRRRRDDGSIVDCMRSNRPSDG